MLNKQSFPYKEYISSLFLDEYTHIHNVLLESIFDSNILYITYDSSYLIRLLKDKSNKSSSESIVYEVCNCVAFINHLNNVFNYKSDLNLAFNLFIKNINRFIVGLLDTYNAGKEHFENLKMVVDFNIEEEQDSFIKFIKNIFNKRVRSKGFSNTFIVFINYLIDLLNEIANKFDSHIVFNFKYKLKYDKLNENDYYCVKFINKFLPAKYTKETYNFKTY